MTRLRLANRRNRRGFTLIELLVVISIIAVLLSLIAPAVQNARRAARRMECSSHMHNVAIAVHNFASTNNGTLPPLIGTMKAAGIDIAVTWAIPLLPVMDESALYRTIRETGVIPTTYTIKVLTCPEDQNNLGKAGGLSYAANAGYISNKLWGSDTGYKHYLYSVNYNGSANTTWSSGTATTCGLDSGDATVAAATGVFWRNTGVLYCSSTTGDYANSDPRVTLDTIGSGDGLTQTLMFAENINSTQWYTPRIDTCAFGIAVDEASPIGVTGQLWPLPSGFGTGTSQTLTFRSEQINNMPTASAQTLTGIPRPSSMHLGVVNVVFCDGSVRSLNDNLDSTVYARLLTPDGKTFSQPLFSGTSY